MISFPDSPDEFARADPPDFAKAHDLATPAFDLGSPDDISDLPIASLCNDIGLEISDEGERRLGSEGDHPVDTGEAGDHSHALRERNDGSRFAFECANARIAIECNDEAISELSRFFERMDMTYVKEVKTAIGEYDRLAAGLSVLSGLDDAGMSEHFVAGLVGIHGGVSISVLEGSNCGLFLFVTGLVS